MAACEKITVLYDGNLNTEERTPMHIKAIDLSAERIHEMLTYDPITGKFTWLSSPNRSMKAGDEAGSPKYPKGPNGPTYLYITLDGVSTPAARVAWFFLHGHWPETAVKFADGDTTNLRGVNLKLAAFPTKHEVRDGRRIYKMTKEAQRHYGLKRNYGLSPEQYATMITEQKGVCAICAQPETAMANGVPKTMHVDHDHTTGVVRALLCGSCNTAIGSMRDDPARLRAAADYIEKHAAKVVPLKKDGAA